MSLTISNSTGDGVNDTLIRLSIYLPDSGTSVQLDGAVQAPGSAAATVSGTVAAPAAPASGNVYWIIEVNTSTGVPAVISSTTVMPQADPGTVLVFQQTLAAGSTDPALVATDTTPDTY